jgi:hypothetical protein
LGDIKKQLYTNNEGVYVRLWVTGKDKKRLHTNDKGLNVRFAW